jgi:hypothetical protein
MSTVLAFFAGSSFSIALFLATQMIYVKIKSRRPKKIGFARMTPERRREISKMGGLAAQKARLTKQTLIMQIDRKK